MTTKHCYLLVGVGSFNMKRTSALQMQPELSVAALFTEDAVLVAPDGIFSGKQTIEKRYEDTFQRWPFTQFNDPREWSLGVFACPRRKV
jgi:hypothetical protein